MGGQQEKINCILERAATNWKMQFSNTIKMVPRLFKNIRNKLNKIYIIMTENYKHL
jgi:hypothetical protein